MARPRLMIPGTSARPPIQELGTMGAVQGSGFGVSAWSQFIDTKEYVAELMWPNSVRTYDQMRTDSQLAALLFGITMPIRRYKWMLDPQGAELSKVERLADNLNLDIVGQEPRPRSRMKDRFSHDAHLRRSLTYGLIYGHYFAEAYGFIDADNLWTLRKLAERLPSTIQQIKVAPDGGLVSIKQWDPKSKEIPVDNLIAYIWEGDGGNWAGRSLFRDCYKNWLIKDRLLRVDAINHERAGGVPLPVAGDDASDEEMELLNQLAQGFHIGESAGGALPPGTKWQIARATNTNVIESVRYHDESMARRVLMMVAMLAQGGTSLGSYALGEVFTDFFSLGQQAIANWYKETTQAYFVEDYWDWNYGPEDPDIPQLVYVKDADEALSVQDLALLAQHGLLVVDKELEATIRKRYSLPENSGEPPEGAPVNIPNENKPKEVTGGTSPAADGSPASTAASAELGEGEEARGRAPSQPPSPDPELEAERAERRSILATLSGMFQGLMSRQPEQVSHQTSINVPDINIPEPKVELAEGAVQVEVRQPPNQITVEPSPPPNVSVVNSQQRPSRARVNKDKKTGEITVDYEYDK